MWCNIAYNITSLHGRLRQPRRTREFANLYKSSTNKGVRTVDDDVDAMDGIPTNVIENIDCVQ